MSMILMKLPFVSLDIVFIVCVLGLCKFVRYPYIERDFERYKALHINYKVLHGHNKAAM